MKRLLSVTLAVLLMFLVACTPKETVQPTPSTSESPIVSASPVPENGVAIKIGNVDISNDEYRYHFYSTVQAFMNQYGSLLTDIGLDPQKPFEEQQYDESTTWMQFFQDQANQGLQNTVMLSEQARKENITLSPDFSQQLEKSIESMRTYCIQNNTTMEKELKANYGGTVTEDTIRKALERMYLGFQFSTQKRNSFSFAEAEIEQYYKAHADEFDQVNYRSHAFAAEMSEDGLTVVDDTKAKADADAFLNAITDEASFLKYTKDKLKLETDNTLQTGVPSEGDALANWLYDPARKAGDKTVIAQDASVYVLFFVDRFRPDAPCVAVRHILYTSETDGADGARQKAQTLYDKWKADGAKEDDFSNLAKEFSTDPGSAAEGGLYNDVVQGQMVPTFDEWCFDESRKYGDSGLVDTDYGTHIMFFVGKTPLWIGEVRTTLMENAYNTYCEELEAQYVPQTMTIALGK